jgi:G3E family GTPase
MAPIPFYLVTGFLGSGKTTLLKQIIDNNDQERKIAVIQNEFAPANIDGIELKDLNKPFHILEINNGSVFCVCLLGDFISALKIFIEEEQPDVVILESSGLADPIAITEILQTNMINKLVYLAACWCIVDIVNFKRMQSMLTRVKHQITIADYLILNKTDQAGSDMIEAVKEQVSSINALAEIIEASYCNIDPGIFFNSSNVNKNQNRADNILEESCGKPMINARVFKSSKKIGVHNLKKIIRKYIHYTQRIKGYVLLEDNTVASVQTVFNKVDIKIMKEKTGNTALILMGESFNLSEFSKDFRQLT